jgi:hypothetical protein
MTDIEIKENIMLNARGTIIEVPYDFLNKSQVVEAWHNALVKDDIQKKLYLNVDPNDVHKMLNNIYKIPHTTEYLIDYLAIKKTKRQHQINDSCTISFCRNIITIQYLLINADIGLELQFKFNNMYMPNRQNDILCSNNKYFIIESCSNLYSMTLSINEYILNINYMDIINAIKQQLKNGITFEDYMKNNKLVCYASNIDKNCLGKIVFGLKNSSLDGEILQIIMCKYFVNICCGAKIKPSVLRKIIDLLDNIQIKNN